MPSEMKVWCRHFTGIQNETCEANVNYRTVRDTSGPGMAKWPCTRNGDTGVIQCLGFEPYTQAEIDERDRQLSEALTGLFRLQKRETDICPQCGKQITSMEQVGRCVYASCGCRLYQGSVPEAWR